ncbi:MAG: hypothetical protein FWF87_05490 [Synergistaceae bacterium]|nr:hypothetical protein [Synergistaceae bacterium]
MSKGYLAKEAARHEKDYAKQLIFFWIIALILTPALFYAARYMSERSPAVVIILQIVIATGLTILLFPTVFFFFRVIKQWISPELYGNLIVYAENVGKEGAGWKIDAEAAEGKILVEEYIHFFNGRKVIRTKRKVVLLPSYLLITIGEGDITAIPTDKIYWICIQVGYREGFPIGKLKVFYDRKIQDIENIEFLHTYYIVERIQQHLPNVFQNYNPFMLSYELESIFHRDYNKFIEIYNQHKKQCEE